MTTKNTIEENKAPHSDVAAAYETFARQKKANIGTLLTKTVATAACLAIATLSVESIFAMCGLGEEEYVRPDPLFGVAHIPGKSVTFRSEGFSRGKFSSVGLRDTEHEIVKAPGVTRIAFLGDSKTEGLQVPLDETFVKIVERKLNHLATAPGSKEPAPAPKYETINFATSGSGPLVELLHYLHTVQTYKPDTVVLIYNYGDSIDNGQSGASSSLLARPCASFDKDGNISISYTQLDNWFASDSTKFKFASAWLREHSRIFQLGTDLDLSLRGDSKEYAKFSDLVIKPVCMALGKAFVPNGKGYEQTAADAKAERERLMAEVSRLDREVSHERIVAPRLTELDLHARSIESAGFAAVDSNYRRNMELTGRLVELLAQACKDNGSKFVVVTLPAPDNSTFYFWEVRALQKLGERQGFSVVDCNKSFPKIAAMEQNPYYYSAHLAEPGHRLVAKVIAEIFTGR